MAVELEQKGGAFLLGSPSPAMVVTPEDLTDEQKMIAETARDFAEQQVRPALPALEKKDYALSRQLLLAAGELGLLGAGIPEAYGGLELDKVTSTLISETSAAATGGFSITMGAHTGIGTLPIVFFGNAEQKRRYLPDLATAQRVAAYCLTEANSGSDALGARTTARLTPDGKHYVLNGTKQWITNGGFADVFIIYAKIDGEQFSAFIVEKNYPGVSTGPEEHKMGLEASSTTEVILQDVHVPVENLLYIAGKGHHVAFNILNIGRFSLAVGCLGKSKGIIEVSARYARERHQFGKPIASFRLIQQKLADMAIRTYALESMVYRTAGLWDRGLQGIDLEAETGGQDAARAIAEYAIEASVNKVFGTEVLQFVVDEGVQIHGGYGFMREYQVENEYRDSRINRIFEGTNEINRLLIPATLMRKALKGELPFMAAAGSLQSELMTLTPPMSFGPEPLAQELWMLEAARKTFLMVAGLAVQKHMQALEEEQELLGIIADLAIEVFAMESAILRTQKALARDAAAAGLKVDMTRAYVHQAFPRVEAWARAGLAALEQGDLLRTNLAVLRKLLRYEPSDTVGLGRRVAEQVLAAEGYVC